MGSPPPDRLPKTKQLEGTIHIPLSANLRQLIEFTGGTTYETGPFKSMGPCCNHDPNACPLTTAHLFHSKSLFGKKKAKKRQQDHPLNAWKTLLRNPLKRGLLFRFCCSVSFSRDQTIFDPRMVTVVEQMSACHSASVQMPCWKISAQSALQAIDFSADQ